MARDSRYDVLFEPVQIGPVTAKNRFYQVPHCCGMGHLKPNTAAAMRGIKAEGGWAVVSTEECDVHHTSDVSPFVEHRLWSDEDIPMHAKMVDAVHQHGALAAIELAHSGIHSHNYYSRSRALAPSAGPAPDYSPSYAAAMTKRDIREIRRIFRTAARRARIAGFDIVYVYAAHMLTLPAQFLSKRFNRRTDEYGGSLTNRVRLLKEMIEDAKDEVGDECGIACRLMLDELLGEHGLQCGEEGIEIVSLLAELPDLWDVNVSDWDNDSAASRFQDEGFQEQYIAQVKQVTAKPVVGVGRFTSPDTMVSQIRRGIVDMIGAARPSIADPFLPQKIEQGRIEDIRECIGCNICVSGDYTMTPIRCTQNPTMGEEWRRGWHPEMIPPAASSQTVLIVGAGPAGLECAVALGQRGVEVTLTDSRETLGGRVTRESQLCGLSAWGRVRDYRLGQLAKLTNVALYPASSMTAADIVNFGVDNVVLATGSTWRRDGVGPERFTPLPGSDCKNVYTPDDVMDGVLLAGTVVVYDDEHFYMGGVIAEHLASSGAQVILVTPAQSVSYWTQYTLEQRFVCQRLQQAGVEVHVNTQMHSIEPDHVTVQNAFSTTLETIRCDAVVLTTGLQSSDSLMTELAEQDGGGSMSVECIGDCSVPGTIAAAVYSGHAFARRFGDGEQANDLPFRMERAVLSSSK